MRLRARRPSCATWQVTFITDGGGDIATCRATSTPTPSTCSTGSTSRCGSPSGRTSPRAAFPAAGPRPADGSRGRSSRPRRRGDPAREAVSLARQRVPRPASRRRPRDRPRHRRPGTQQRSLLKALREFATYIRGDETPIPNYGERYCAGGAISSSLAESTINQVVSKRMVKKQQMRWSHRGAHLLLQIRTPLSVNVT